MNRRTGLHIVASAGLIAIGYTTLCYAYAKLANREGPREASAPQLTIADTVVALGVVAPGHRCDVTFSVQNSGDRRLVLIALVPECECVRAREVEIVIDPHRTAPVKVAFHAPSNPGAFDLAIKFATNDAAHPQLNLTIRADVE